MPFMGGVFTRLYSWVTDDAASIPITASRMDADTNDIVGGLNTTVLKDGTNVPTANLPMANFRHTGVSDGVARTDYASVGQAQDNKLDWVVAGGTADALTLVYNPVIISLSDGQEIKFRVLAANITTTPTALINGSVGPYTFTKNGGQLLAAGDFPGNLAEMTARFNANTNHLEVVNPKSSAGGGTGTVGQVSLVGGSGVAVTGNSNITTTGTATLSLGSIGTLTVLGNVTGGSAAPIALSKAQHTTLVNVFTSTLSGAVPASGGGTSTYLRADGAFAAPPTTAGSLSAGTTNTKATLATGVSTQSHSLGSIPSLVVAYIECLSTELGYAVGDRIALNSIIQPAAGTSPNNDDLVVVVYDATNTVIIVQSVGVTTFLIPQKTGSQLNSITNAKWKAVAVPYKIN